MARAGAPWTDEEARLLEEMYYAGIPDADIAAELDRTQMAVKVKRERLGLTRYHDHNRLTESVREKLRIKPTGDNSPMWKGGRRINHNGYIEVFEPNHPRARGNGYVFEHILVMEKMLGRSLNLEETVHHKDHNKQNNHPSNLKLVTRSEHTKLHPKKRTGQWLECPICGGEFYVKTSHVPKRTTCSMECMAELYRRRVQEKRESAC